MGTYIRNTKKLKSFRWGIIGENCTFHILSVDFYPWKERFHYRHNFPFSAFCLYSMRASQKSWRSRKRRKLGAMSAIFWTLRAGGAAGRAASRTGETAQVFVQCLRISSRILKTIFVSLEPPLSKDSCRRSMSNVHFQNLKWLHSEFQALFVMHVQRRFGWNSSNVSFRVEFA